MATRYRFLSRKATNRRSRPDEPPLPGDEEQLPPPEPPLPPDEPGVKRVKYVIGGEVTVYVVAERVQYYGPDGRLITESLKDYTRRAVRKEYASLDDFLRRWSSAEQKQALIAELEEHGILLEALAEEVGRNFDPFDLICHIAFDRPPLTRRERAANVKKRDVFTKYGPQARAVLEALLAKYQDEGLVGELDNVKMLEIPPFSAMGTPLQLIKPFGGKAGFEQAVHELQAALYQESA